MSTAWEGVDDCTIVVQLAQSHTNQGFICSPSTAQRGLLHCCSLALYAMLALFLGFIYFLGPYF